MSIRAARPLAPPGLAVAGVAGRSPPAAPAEPTIPIDWNIDATVHLASLNIDQTVTGGSFVGAADVGAGTVAGTRRCRPPASSSSCSGSTWPTSASPDAGRRDQRHLRPER